CPASRRWNGCGPAAGRPSSRPVPAWQHRHTRPWQRSSYRFSSNAAAVADLDDVQAAFLLRRARPAPGALVGPGFDRDGTWPATDARVAVVVQRVVGDVVLEDEVPHVLLRPAHQGVDLDQGELGVPPDDAGLRPVLGLVAANGADPGVVPL